MNGGKVEIELALPSYMTEDYPCSYLSGQRARSQVISSDKVSDPSIYSTLINMGFRRSGLLVYRPSCDACRACLPIRVPVHTFQLSRSQKKVKKQLSYLSTSVCELKDTQEYYQLYQRYQKKRHLGGGMDDDQREQYHHFLGVSSVETKVVEYRDEVDKRCQNTLKMVSIIDILQNGLSAVYTYFEPEEKKLSYGTYSILWLIDFAKSLGLSYVYLGYWIDSSQKMKYKSNFSPFELLSTQGWERVDNKMM